MSADFLEGSGLRADLDLPDGYGTDPQRRSPALLHADQSWCEPTPSTSRNEDLTTRFDVINVLDQVYEIRNGTGVGVGAPQFGPRRGLFLGISKTI